MKTEYQTFLAKFENGDNGKFVSFHIAMPIGDFENSWRQALEMALERGQETESWLLRKLTMDDGTAIVTDKEAQMDGFEW